MFFLSSSARANIARCSKAFWARSLLIVLVVWSGMCRDATAASSDFIFTKVVDTASNVPSSNASFTSFTDAAFDGQNVVFRGDLSGGSEGVYLWNGSLLSSVANTSTALPGGGGNFADFGQVSIDNGRVAFFGGNASREGVYTTLGGPLRRVVDSTSAVPGGGSTYDPSWINSPFDLAIDGGDIVFSSSAGSGSNQGVFRESSGNVSLVADLNTSPPGAANGNFANFDSVDIDNGDVLFSADLDLPSSWGFYTSAGVGQGQLRKAIDSETPIPGLPTPTFEFLPNTIRVDNGELVFVASFIFRNGLYKETNGEVSIIADELRPDPITGNPFATFGGTYSYDEGATAFIGNSSGTSSGIYFDRKGGLVDVINEDFVLDGVGVDRLNLFPESLAADTILFGVELENGRDALYLAKSIGLEHFLLPGDYNSNGAVDAADYNAWRDTFGQSGLNLRADGNGDGRVGASDFVIWRDNFGRRVGGLAQVVPEPSAVALGLAGLIMALTVRSRRGCAR